jgi:tyrosyl-tRNA synthetase
MKTSGFLDDLGWRGLLHQYTEGLPEYLARNRVTVYAGFDPTAPSLHVGNLIPVLNLTRMQQAGHRPLVMVGGGTGMIGDPSGKSSERQLSTPDVVAANAAAIRGQLERFVDFSGTAGARMVDNAEWLLPLTAVEFMRDVGKHFSINYMLAKESVRSRLEGGISYTEFSYMLLQAYDYLVVHDREGATLQIGGSDQWGNITAGVELIRRARGREAHGLTFPLVTTAGGVKFGKTEAGAVWLDPARTTPYRFYQFWINTDDRDVGTFLRYFTLLPRAEIEAAEAELRAHPERREAQQLLARDVTARLHGDEAARISAEVSSILFGRGEPASLSVSALEALAREVPFAELPAPADGADALELFTAAGLVQSKGAGRRLLEQGGLYVNGIRLSSDTRAISGERRLHGGYLLLRKGTRDYALILLRD